MLMKLPTAQPAMTYARTGAYAVRLATGIKCPHCLRQLKATDIEVVDFGNNVEVAVRLICTGCHRDMLTIGTVE